MPQYELIERTNQALLIAEANGFLHTVEALRALLEEATLAYAQKPVHFDSTFLTQDNLGCCRVLPVSSVL